MDMGMTLAAMAGRWIAPQAHRKASPPTQLQNLRYAKVEAKPQTEPSGNLPSPPTQVQNLRSCQTLGYTLG